MGAYISYRSVLTLALSFVLFFSFISSLFAQENTTSTQDNAVQQVRPAQVDQLRKSVEEGIEAKRATALQRNAAKRAEFTERVAEISDEAKKNAVERINTALQKINENRTIRWANALDKLSSVLERIKTAVSSLEGNGADTTSINGLITTAEATIASAIVSVETQAEKDYIIEITDETTLGQAVRSVVQQFKQDLKTTLTSVASARDAVRQAARALASISTPSNPSTQNQTLDMQPNSTNDIFE